MTTTIALLFSTLLLAAEPTTPSPPPSPAAEVAPGAPPSEPPAEPSGWTIGLDVLVPKQETGRLLEFPFTLAVETAGLRVGPTELALRAGLGYAQLSRAEACATADCYPALGVTLGGLARLGTAPERPLAGWVSLGVGIQGASNWDLNVLGLYARVDAGIDLGGNERNRLRLSIGWVAAGFTEDRPELEPGRQRYLAFTLAFGPGKTPAAGAGQAAPPAK